MMSISTARIALVITLLFCLTGQGLAQEYRSNMKVPPVELYGSMLKLAAKADYAKITKSLPFLDGIFSEERKKFGLDVKGEIEAALGEKGNGAAITAIQQAIFYDIKDIFLVIKGRGNSESAATLRTWLMMASLDYKLLAPSIQEKSFKTREEIERSFTRAFSSLNVEASPLMAEKSNRAVDLTALGELLTGIEDNIFSVFPEFKRPK